MSRGLIQRLETFERSVRRLDGSQDGAAEFADAREILKGGVDESVDAIDEARERGLPFANLAAAVDRCRVALANVRGRPDMIQPLPVDESLTRRDDAALSHASRHTDEEILGANRTPQESLHPSQIPLPGSSHGSVRDLVQAREELDRLSQARDVAAQRVEDLDKRR